MRGGAERKPLASAPVNGATVGFAKAHQPRYKTIVADPPWEYDDGFAFKTSDGSFRTQDLPYGSMTLEDILALPVRALADPKGCALFLWTTNRFLGDTFDVLGSWGFRYRQTIVWRKTNPQPVGGSVAPNAEFLLVARRGPHTWSGPRWPDSVIDAPRTTHSAKPEVFIDLIESISPPPYLEMFSRRARLGWDTWGNEALEHVSLAAAALGVEGPAAGDGQP